MAVISVTTRLGQSVDVVANAGSGGGNSSAQIEFDVVVSSPLDNESHVLLAPGIPLVGLSPHPALPNLRCRTLTPIKVAPILWKLVARYEGAVNSQNQGGPLDEPPDIKWGTVSYEEEIDVDLDDTPIWTPNYEPYEPKLRLMRRDLILRITRNIPSFDVSQIVPYCDNGGATNSDTPWGQPVGTARINDLQSQEIAWDGGVYHRTYVEVQFRRGRGSIPDSKAFYKRVLQQGFMERISADVGFTDEDYVAHATDGAGRKATRPVLLDDDGFQIFVTPGEIPGAKYQYFRVHDSLPFSVVGVFQ